MESILSLYWAIAYTRENYADLSIDDMTGQLEAMCEVVDGWLGYNEFIRKVELKDRRNS